MQRGWKKERTARASFPGPSGAEVWQKKNRQEESLEAEFCPKALYLKMLDIIGNKWVQLQGSSKILWADFTGTIR